MKKLLVILFLFGCAASKKVQPSNYKTLIIGKNTFTGEPNDSSSGKGLYIKVRTPSSSNLLEGQNFGSEFYTTIFDTIQCRLWLNDSLKFKKINL